MDARGGVVTKEVFLLHARGAPPHMIKLQLSRQTWAEKGAALRDWLDQTIEQALEPELEIVDPHHHIWDMRELNGYNLFGMFKHQYYVADELVVDFVGGGHNVTHTVFVQTHSFFSADATHHGAARRGVGRQWHYRALRERQIRQTALHRGHCRLREPVEIRR